HKMAGFLKRYQHRLTKQDIYNLSCFFYSASNGLLASVFFNLPLSLKRHCVQVGVIAGQMAAYAPERAIPEDMTRDEYASAVRYGCLYHDIGAYLVYNQRQLYPAAGERFLREQLAEEAANQKARRVILETVQYCGERYDGQGYPDKLAGDKIPLHAGICAIGDEIDGIITGRNGLFQNPAAQAKRYVYENNRAAFLPDAVGCFAEAYRDISGLYKYWRKIPLFWNNSDIKPIFSVISG
ncbi:MAG: HD domain-containing protein, partial [Oscillospiraceae bacterium]|nr:HD domain-containing protein [Oscillospiraceae bacterium]